MDVSAESFQVKDEWMRVSSRRAGAGVTLSTHASEAHWLNPPRGNTTDAPLEFEWFMYFDTPSEWGWEGLHGNLTEVNWSAFWMFGHGKDFYGWPMGGEWDLVEWLPGFGVGDPLGATTGFHNMDTGAYPPCCMRAADGIVYNKSCTPETCGYDEAASPSHPELKLAWPTASKFRSWGQAYDKAANKPARSHVEADGQTYNRILHNYARCTVDTFDIFSKADADPADTPAIQADWSDEQFAKAGYAHMFRAHADFGSNEDMLYQDTFPGRIGQMSGRPDIWNKQPLSTNWHQNMAFVWSIIRQNGTRTTGNPAAPAAIATVLTADLPMSFYISDIHIRGGGNNTKAQAPTNLEPNTTHIPEDVPVQLSDVTPCWWIQGGPPNCYKRLESYYQSHGHPADYGALP
jgi:hypothetical protein